MKNTYWGRRLADLLNSRRDDPYPEMRAHFKGLPSTIAVILVIAALFLVAWR